MDLTLLENRASFSDVPLDMMVMKLLKEKFTVLKRLFTHAKCKRLSVVLDIVTNPSEFKVIIHERFQSIIIFISTKIEPSVSSKIESVPSSLLSLPRQLIPLAVYSTSHQSAQSKLGNPHLMKGRKISPRSLISFGTGAVSMTSSEVS
jgi:hypothetical protein